jgi:hypothetical protein
MRYVVVIQAASTLMMTGVIWFVQVVHYPLMSRTGRAGFPDYEARHTRLTTLVVAPLMLAEAVTAGLLLLWRPPQIPLPGAILGGGLLAVIWLSTSLLQVPLHRRLAQGFEERAHRHLVTTNWIRTISWTARAALVSYWLAR